jgi:hypothetical protein
MLYVMPVTFGFDIRMLKFCLSPLPSNWHPFNSILEHHDVSRCLSREVRARSCYLRLSVAVCDRELATDGSLWVGRAFDMNDDC